MFTLIIFTSLLGLVVCLAALYLHERGERLAADDALKVRRYGRLRCVHCGYTLGVLGMTRGPEDLGEREIRSTDGPSIVSRWEHAR